MANAASIVIPAHNEENRIRGLLEALCDPSILSTCDIYIVCNGCSDNTFQVAKEYPGFVVVEISDAGKHLALNEGDRLAGDIYPRLYCDADTLVTASSIGALVDLLTTEDVRAAGPSVRYGDDLSAWTVKLYVRALQTPLMAKWLDQHLTGRGLYGVSRIGRKQFNSFPPMFADDLFFDSQFDLSEKRVARDAIVTVWVPQKLRTLIVSEVRVLEGNQQFRVTVHSEAEPDRPGTVGPRHSRIRIASRWIVVRTWMRDLRLRDVAPMMVYLGVIWSAKSILVIRKLRGREIRWR